MRQLNYTTNLNNNQSFRKKHFNHLSMADRLNIEKLLLLKNDKSYKGEKLLLLISPKLLVLIKALFLEK